MIAREWDLARPVDRGLLRVNGGILRTIILKVVQERGFEDPRHRRRHAKHGIAFPRNVQFDLAMVGENNLSTMARIPLTSRPWRTILLFYRGITHEGDVAI